MKTNTAVVLRRCGNCGVQTPEGQGCSDCGATRKNRGSKLRLLSAALSNEGNGYVENNVNNIAVHGDVNLGTYIAPMDEDEEEERVGRRIRNRRPTATGSFLAFTGGVMMWMSILVMGCVFAGFAAIIWAAYVK